MKNEDKLLTKPFSGLIQARYADLQSPRGQASGDARVLRGPEVAARCPQPDLAASATQP